MNTRPFYPPNDPRAYLPTDARREAELRAVMVQRLGPNRETFNVRNFGVVGDGIHDDTLAFQRAVDDAVGSVVLVPPGTYIVSDNIELPSNSRIVGADGAVVQCKASTLLTPAIFTAFGTVGSRKSNIHLEGLTLDGNRSNRTIRAPNLDPNENNAEFEYCDNVTVRGVTSKNAVWNGMTFTQCTRVSVQQCYIHTNSKNGVYLSAGVQNAIVQGNVIHDCMWAQWIEDGFDYSYAGIGNLGCWDFDFSGNLIYNCRVGIGMGGSSSYLHRRGVIAGNVIYDDRTTAILPEDGGRLMNRAIRIEDSTPEGEVVFTPYEADIVVSDNVCRGALEENIRLTNMQNVALRGNRLHDGQKYNLVIGNGCSDIEVAGGQQTNCGTAAGGASMRLYGCDRVLIHGVRAYDTAAVAGDKTQLFAVQMLLDAPATADTTNVTMRNNDFTGNRSGRVSISGSTYAYSGIIVDSNPDEPVQAFTAADASPSVVLGHSFKTANIAPQNVSRFDDTYPGQEFTVLVDDANTTLVHSANLVLAGGVNYSPVNGELMTFRRIGGAVYEVGRATVSEPTVTDGWYYDNLAAALGATEMTRGDGRWRAVRAGSLTGLVITSTEARTGGTCTAEVFLNTGLAGAAGSGTGLTAVLNATNTSRKATTQVVDTDTFAAGDELYVVLSSATWGPTTADIRCAIEVEDG